VSRKVPTRLSPGVFERRLASGEVHAIARSLPADATGADLARALGMTPDALVCARIRLRARGVRVPSIDEMRSIANQGTRALVDEMPSSLFANRELLSADEKPLAGSIPDREPPATSVSDQKSRWPSVEQFDREERMVVTAESTLFDAEGNVKLTWVKTKAENDERRDWLQAIRDMGGELPQVEPVAAPSDASELLVVLPIGDPHVGLLSWHEDAGENFDLDVAEQPRNVSPLAARQRHSRLVRRTQDRLRSPV
jgi:hypothetical protein